VTAVDPSEYPVYMAYTSYAPGDIVSRDGVLYRVRADFDGSPGQTPGAYTPGEGYAWRDAWDAV
jgi:hypothetical protein